MLEENRLTLPPLQPVKRPRKARGAILALVPLLLLAAILGGYRNGRPAFQESRALLGRIPAMQQWLASLSSRMDDVDRRLGIWTSERDGLKERMAKLETRLQGNIQLARRAALEAASQAGVRLQAEMDQRTQETRARIDQIESAQQSEEARLARLQEEIIGVRHDMNRQMALARQENARELSGFSRRFADLSAQVNHSRSDWEALAQQVDRRRIDFEANKGRSQEIAPGVSLHVTHTDTSFRRFDGWIWLSADRRALWVRGQGVQQPIVFYSKRDGPPDDVVITNITKKGVAGYVLIPRDPSGAGPVADAAQHAAATAE